MFAAFAWSDLLANKTAEETATRPEVEAAGLLGFLQQKRFTWSKSAVLVALLMVGVWITLPAAQESVRNSSPADRYAEAATWLAENTPEGSRVFQTDWDDFTRLFYYNTHNTYLVGLDPTYLQIYDSILYDLWHEITRGNVENPSRDIRGVFEARYVFSDLNHTGFIQQAEQDSGLEEIYRDEYAVIYEVIE